MTKEELSEEQLRKRGLYFLLYNAAWPCAEYQMSKNFPYFTPLKSHPFGLSFPALPNPKASYATYDKIKYLGNPGVTEISVQRMATMVAYSLAKNGYMCSEIIYLRTIYAQANADAPDHHHVLYEVGTNYDVLMCGGCTDCSGTGGWGKDEMDSIFSLLSELYSIPIQKTRIEHPRSMKYFRQLEMEIYNYQKLTEQK